MKSFLLALGAAVVSALAWPAIVFAQEFQKVEGKLADEIPAVPFVGIAYGFIWVAVLVYVFALARGLGRVKGDLAALRRKIESTGAVAGREAPRT